MRQWITISFTGVILIVTIWYGGWIDHHLPSHPESFGQKNDQAFSALPPEHLKLNQETQMSDNIIAAEVEPQLNQEKKAALALQRLGFQILHIGQTLSVQAPQSLWESTFNLEFEQRQKKVMAEIEDTVTYSQVQTGVVQIPEELQPYILNVYFVEPPQLF